MPTKMITRSIKVQPEVWELLQNLSDEKNISTSNFVRECIEDYLKDYCKKRFLELIEEADKKAYGDGVKEERNRQISQFIMSEFYDKLDVIEIIKMLNDYLKQE
jgi:predicted DNA-binding protein